MKAAKFQRICAAALVSAIFLSCTTTRTAEWIKHYRPPTNLAGQIPGASVPDLRGAQLLGGDTILWRDDLKVQLSSYFVPYNSSPFPGARVTWIQYLYCSFNYWPHLCGLLVSYESEEGNAVLGLPIKVTTTNHETIINTLIAEHRKPQLTQGNARTLITMPDGEVLSGDITGEERREWCRAKNEQLPVECEIGIVAVFDAARGHGLVLYAEEALFRFVRAYREAHGFDHQLAIVLFNRFKTLSEEEIQKRQEQFSPLDEAQLLGEQQLNRASEQTDFKRTRQPLAARPADFFRQLYAATLQLQKRYLPRAEFEFWRGYRAGLIDRQFSREQISGLDTVAYERWKLAAQAPDPLLQFASMGYEQGIKGLAPVPVEIVGNRCAEFGFFKRVACRWHTREKR